ncbi:hypothetical protein T484DRAFT_1933231 [Baffinella frigidus]|nr:hypothetical protein T484DRAFT_1933231 [Cryptophyta sp. CCMP2293]
MLFIKLQSMEEHQAGRHAGDTGPGGSSKGPCAIAGMFGCTSAGSTEEYGQPWFPSDASGAAPWPTTRDS